MGYSCHFGYECVPDFIGKLNFESHFDQSIKMAFFRKLFCLPAQPVNHFIMNLPLTKLTCLLAIISISLLACTKTEKPAENSTPENEWVSLWDGETLNGWEAAENPEAFTIEEGKIVVNGTRGHLFYQGPVANANFDDFEFKAEVYTMPDANSGIFFHTKYQEEGWPSNGYEAQVNATYDPDPRKTGSLYSVNDVMNNAPHVDEEWFTYHITVNGQNITFKINGEPVMEFTEPENVEGTKKLSSGTFALQAHDPKSKVYYRNIQVKPLN
jgi:hypothetical protein